jgi:RNA polymerase sigma factor (sigma-70 family)
LTRHRTDEEWLLELRSSGQPQRDAFADLGRYLYRVVYNYLLRRQNGIARLRALDFGELEALAERFAQDALETIWEKLDSYEGRGRLTSWAATIAVHEAAAELRRPLWREERMALTVTGGSDDHPEEWGGPRGEWRIAREPSPERSLRDAEVLDLIETAIEQDLSERQRFAFLAQFVEGRSGDDIAHELGTTRNAVYLLVYEARRKIKERITEAGYELESQ